MKVCLLLAFTGFAGLATPAFASTNVSYTATADPNTAPDGVDSNGNAVDVWTFGHAGSDTGATAPNNYGSFLGNSGANGGGSGAGAGTSAWGLYANRDYTGATNSGNEANIGYTFAGGMLTLGQSVSIAFDGGYVDTGNQYGLRLFNSSGFALSLSFVGGDSAYRYYDNATSGNSAGFGYTPDGFTFKYTQLTLTTYSAVVTQGTATLGSWTGTVNSAPTFIQVYDSSAGSGSNYDVYANNLQIVPEPGSLTLCGGLGAVLLGLARRRRTGGQPA